MRGATGSCSPRVISHGGCLPGCWISRGPIGTGRVNVVGADLQIGRAIGREMERCPRKSAADGQHRGLGTAATIESAASAVGRGPQRDEGPQPLHYTPHLVWGEPNAEGKKRKFRLKSCIGGCRRKAPAENASRCASRYLGYVSVVGVMAPPSGAMPR